MSWRDGRPISREARGEDDGFAGARAGWGAARSTSVPLGRGSLWHGWVRTRSELGSELRGRVWKCSCCCLDEVGCCTGLGAGRSGCCCCCCSGGGGERLLLPRAAPILDLHRFHLSSLTPSRRFRQVHDYRTYRTPHAHDLEGRRTRIEDAMRYVSTSRLSFGELYEVAHPVRRRPGTVAGGSVKRTSSSRPLRATRQQQQ
jgi:hypothetical protein